MYRVRDSSQNPFFGLNIKDANMNFDLLHLAAYGLLFFLLLALLHSFCKERAGSNSLVNFLAAPVLGKAAAVLSVASFVAILAVSVPDALKNGTFERHAVGHTWEHENGNSRMTLTNEDGTMMLGFVNRDNSGEWRKGLSGPHEAFFENDQLFMTDPRVNFRCDFQWVEEHTQFMLSGENCGSRGRGSGKFKMMDAN